MIWTPQLFVPQMFAGVWHQAGCCCREVEWSDCECDICSDEDENTPAKVLITIAASNNPAYPCGHQADILSEVVGSRIATNPWIGNCCWWGVKFLIPECPTCNAQSNDWYVDLAFSLREDAGARYYYFQIRYGISASETWCDLCDPDTECSGFCMTRSLGTFDAYWSEVPDDFTCEDIDITHTSFVNGSCDNAVPLLLDSARFEVIRE